VSVDSETIWTCDRCGTRCRFPNPTDARPRPRDWSSLWVVTPPNGALLDLGKHVAHLCAECTKAVTTFATTNPGSKR